jgi:hypothetical protein
MPTLIEELLRDEAFDLVNRLPLIDLTIEPTELARHIEETCNGDPRYDFVGHYADGMDDMPMVDRPKMNELVRKLLLGEITIDEQARLNELAVKAMLEHGLGQVRAALEIARVGHEVAGLIGRGRKSRGRS